MKKRIFASLALLLALCMLLSACGKEKSPAPEDTDTPEASAALPDADTEADEEALTARYPDAQLLRLDGHAASLSGVAVQEFDYTWHCDPGTAHGEVKNAPAEYYTGTKPETDAAAYIDSELYYFPELPEEGFRRVNYDGETEWAYYYTDGEHDDYIFATLPALGGALPTQMMHTAQEAAENRVLHITQPGTYLLVGAWDGQIRVELGGKDDCFADPEKRVTLIFGGADICCTVAPGVIFASAYECDNTWETRETYTDEVDTADAGAVVIIADGTENSVSGTNVFRMLKTQYKDEEAASGAVRTQKKLRKTDAAFYSYVSMNVCGGEENSGTLTVTSGFEGLDSELHLHILGGSLTVNSQDDGINVNEDEVSVVRFSGGEVTLNAALGAEGDGVDSNGFIVLSGGTLRVNGVRVPDSALDSECGVRYAGGTVIIDGETQSYTPGETFRESGGMGFPDGMGGQPGAPGDMGGAPFAADFDIKDFKEKVASLGDDAMLEDVLALLGMGGGRQDAPDGEQMPDGGQRPEMPDGQTPPDFGGQGGQTPPDMPPQGR